MAVAPRTGATTGRPRIVIVGAGFGGLKAARELAGSRFDVTVVDQRNHHTFQPLLYQVATAGLDNDEICYATRGIFHRHSNVQAAQARVASIDLANRRVHIEDGDPLSYDSLVLALGAVTADYGVSGVKEHAFGLKSAAQATDIRNQVLANFERAARTDDLAQRQAATTIVIVGGGPTGVEMAGGFAELFSRVLRQDFPELADTPARVILVEGQERLLGTFAPKLGAKAERRLKEMGVEVRTETQVASVTADAVTLGDGSSLATATVVWAAGVRAHPIADTLDVETTGGGRIVVDDHLRIPDHPEVFVVGDLAAATNNDGTLVPQVAPAAVQAGRHVARLLLQEDATEEPFRYVDKGAMATIGRNAAVVEFPNGRTMSGFVGWAAWLGLHLVMLIGWRNRANVLVNWAWNYLTYDRASRIVIDD